MRKLATAAVVALALPAPAFAHGRTATVALDYRVRVTTAAPGVHVRVLDGDRSLELSVARGTRVVVHGLLGEPVLRFGPGGVDANAASPTALADRIVAQHGTGWVHLTNGSSLAWHDHRLAPPPATRPGFAGRFAIRMTVDGKPGTIVGTFWRVRRPSIWPWLAGAAALAALAAAAAAFRRGWRSYLTIALGTSAGIGALLAVTTFAARDAPNGRVAWLQIGGGLVVGVAFAATLVVLHGRRRVHAAGIVGGVAAAASIGSLPVFWHGVVISLLPATPARLVCGVALVAGAVAAALSFLPDFDEVRRPRR
ncbi:MAG: hypothetical protein JO017_08215 [Actinobacteria bacterium]|nr:hypothetical protein [Actinomycetota bacterium]